MNVRCANCYALLTAEEQRYYLINCEKCEAEWSERMRLYRQGADDPEFDALYGVPTETRH